MAFGNATFSNAGGAVNDLFASRATAQGLRLKADGDDVEGVNYDLAATLAKQNKGFVEQSTAVKDLMSERKTYLGIGGQQSDVASAGFSNSGTALDLLRDSATQGALEQQLIRQQGEITEAGYDEQEKAYGNLATYARQSADTQRQMADNAEEAGNWSAAIKGGAAIATLFI